MGETMEVPIAGRAQGGRARAEKLSGTRRKEISAKAVAARWSGAVMQATHGTPDHPLRIGEIEIPCYVLEDETRVLAQAGVISGLGMKRGSRPGGANRLTDFLRGKALSPFVPQALLERMENPIRFRAPNGTLSYGYPATILADICDAVLAARAKDALQTQQQHIAVRCELLVRGFARVGIIALVDEATGYQRDRARDALARILEDFIAKELQPYVATFPAAFYEHMFRLRGLDYTAGNVKRPQYFGALTNEIVYKRLAPGVLDELKRIKRESGRSSDKLFQRLTQNIGYPKLREHLGSVVTLMRINKEWRPFLEQLDILHPKYNTTLSLPFDYEDDRDDGMGI